MKICKPTYFDAFRCLAGSCPDTCCKDWDIQVDAATAAFYRSVPGSFGDSLRALLQEEDGETIIAVQDGRCPMQGPDGLCRIQTALGHSALCQTCRDFPRLTHDYGSFQEKQLELSCPEAARLILSEPVTLTEEEAHGGEAPEYDEEAMADLLRSREIARCILADESRPVGEVLALLLAYGYQAQGELDGEPVSEFQPDAALETLYSLAATPQMKPILDFFKGLEILTEEWKQRLDTPSPALWTREHLYLARYFVDRYWLQAVSDYDLTSRVKLAVVCCILIRLLGGDLLRTAQLCSKELENDIDNIDAILDGSYDQPALTDDKLLGFLLNKKL